MIDLSWVSGINAFLDTPSPARAVAFGWLMSWGLTQIIKFLPIMRRFPDDVARTVTQIIAFLLAFIPTFMLWPGDTNIKLIASLLVAAWAPTAYSKVTTVLYHFMPFLEKKMSATPVVKS